MQFNLVNITKVIAVAIMSFLISNCTGYLSPVFEVRTLLNSNDKVGIYKFLDHEDPFARREAIISLIKLGECNAQLYKKAMDINPQVRETLANNLVSCNSDSEALKVLLSLADDKVASVRKYSIISSINNNHCRNECYHKLSKLLYDSDSFVKLSASKALYNRFPKEAHNAVLDSLASQIYTVKREAIEVLPSFKIRDDVYYLGEFLEGSDSSLKILARKSIEDILNRPLSGSDYAMITKRESLRENINRSEVNKQPIVISLSNKPDNVSLLNELGIRNNQKTDVNAIAVIIGNKDYSSVDIPKVDYALRDAQLMKEVFNVIFGVPAENIIYVENAKTSEFNKIFGTANNYRGQLANWVTKDSNVYVYYSGHGAPGINDKKAYFVPVDSDVNFIELSGYPLDLLYDNLRTMNVRSGTVILDACFSGISQAGSLTKSASPIFVDIKDEKMAGINNLYVISSSKSNEISSWDSESKHGLFTYHFVKSLKEADRNMDGVITFGELAAYLSSNVQNAARRLLNRSQNPQVFGDRSQIFLKLQ